MGLSSHHIIFLLCLPLLRSPPSAAGQSHRNISLGSSLTPLGRPSSWPSPSGDFAFGFRPLETNASLFLLAVWFDKIPGKTIVWCANGDNPVRDGSTAELTLDSRLSLKDHTGQEVWNASGAAKASYAAMLDSGNFVLAGADPAAPLWQSFENPTDTLLPTQALGMGSQLYARLMDTDYSKGRFELVLQNDGNLVFYPVAVPTGFRYDYYWQSGTNGTGIRLVFDQKGSIYLSQKNTTLLTVTSTNLITGNYYQRATHDPDGVFRQYAFSKDKLGSGSWEVRATAASEICERVLSWIGSGACGFNSYCVLDASGRADCQCPPHYSFVDPDRKYKGCKPEFVAQSCDPGAEAAYEFVNLTNVDWPLCDAEQFSPMNESKCRDNCLSDCFCTVAIYKEGTCYKKKYPLSNGKTGSDIGRKAFIKVSKFNNSLPYRPGPTEEDKRFRRTWVLVGSLLLGSSVLLNFLQVGACFYNRDRRPLHPDTSAAVPGSALRSFTYKELEEATHGFSEEVGRGGFGTVYKGILAVGGPATLVAVKKLVTVMHEAEKDFANEVRSIGQTHHKNLVRLYGFCREEKHRLLVYEFMSNGSLNGFLFGGDRPEWSRRVQIALGIAGGLAYLHGECRTPIIHCDIKPQNILLDDDLDARISDFGLAKLLGIHQTRTSTGIRGTIGYFAPEWFKNIAITAKVDVYSFGVMLLEIICCRRNLEYWELGETSGEKVALADWAKECYRNGRLDLLVEEEEEAVADAMRMERFVMVAISCIQDEPWLRPSMKKVVQMLEGTVPVAVPPNAYI